MKTLLIGLPPPTFGFSYCCHGPKAVEGKCLIIKLPWFQEKFLGKMEHSARLRRQEGDWCAWSPMRKGRNQWHNLSKDTAGQTKITPANFALGILQARKSRESQTLETIQLAWNIPWSDWEQEEGARFPGRWTKGLDSGAGEKWDIGPQQEGCCHLCRCHIDQQKAQLNALRKCFPAMFTDVVVKRK